MLNMLEENIQISCDTSSCNIAFKSVVEDNNDTEDECSDSDAYNEVPVAKIEQCEITKYPPRYGPPIQRGYNGSTRRWANSKLAIQQRYRRPELQRRHNRGSVDHRYNARVMEY